jgi:hypothetical protein
MLVPRVLDTKMQNTISAQKKLELDSPGRAKKLLGNGGLRGKKEKRKLSGG